jgi:hypothetical protein
MRATLLAVIQQAHRLIQRHRTRCDGDPFGSHAAHERDRPAALADIGRPQWQSHPSTLPLLASSA